MFKRVPKLFLLGCCPGKEVGDRGVVSRSRGGGGLQSLTLTEPEDGERQRRACGSFDTKSRCQAGKGDERGSILCSVLLFICGVFRPAAQILLSLSLLPPCVSLSSVSLCHTLTHTPTNATPHLFIAFLCVRDPVGVPVRRLNSRPLVTLLSWSTGLHLCVRRRQRHRRAHAHRNKYKECG